MDKDLYSAVFSLDSIVVFIAILVMCWLGSLAKDFIIVFKGEEKHYVNLTFKFRAGRVIVSTTTSTFLVFALSDIIISHIGFKGLLFVSLLVGIVGFELLEKISTINRVIEFIDLVVFRRSADIRDYKDAIHDDEPRVIVKKYYINGESDKDKIKDDDET